MDVWIMVLIAWLLGVMCGMLYTTRVNNKQRRKELLGSEAEIIASK